MQNCFGKFAQLNINKMKIAIGNDHAGPEYKRRLWICLKQKDEVINYGTDSTDSVDYPDFGHPVATDVAEGKVDFGIIICGR
jgi:ribose 5-phosphate isomerase B